MIKRNLESLPKMDNLLILLEQWPNLI